MDSTSRFYALAAMLLAAPSPVAAAPLLLTNRANPAWVLAPELGDRPCLLKTSLSPLVPFEVATVWSAIGRKRLTISVIGPAAPELFAEILAGYQIGDGKVGKQKTSSYNDADGKNVTTLRFEGDEAKAILEGQPVTFAVSTSALVHLDTLGLWGGLAAVEACERNELVKAGIPQALVTELAVEPYAEMKEFFSEADYPPAALRAGEQGLVRTMLIIKPDGRVRECRILESSGSKSLDRTTCAIIRERGRFQPGRNRQGQPIDAPVISGVRWALP